MLFRSTIRAYTVHEPPMPAADRGDRAERLVFVRDGFSLSAFLFAPLWMAMNRIWWPLVGYIAVATLIVLIVDGLALDSRLTLYGILALHLIAGFEADSLKRFALNRRGWRLVSAVTGTTYEDCERRFFDYWLKTVPAVSTGNFAQPGTSGGLSPAGLGNTARSGDVLPPKRQSWSATFKLPRRQ